MRNLCTLVVAMLTLSAATAGVEVIYGTDDRQDIYQTNNALHLRLARSTAGMIKKSHLVAGATAKTYQVSNAPTLERSQNICTSEKFSEQKLAPVCSGFLVGPDTLITAGHCYNTFDTVENNCKKFVWVFDYDMKSESHDPAQSIAEKNIYQCKKVVSAVRNHLYDFAIIKLDRKVVGRPALKYRKSGKLPNSTPLMVIGHPSGLPTKIATGGIVTYNSEATRFSTTLDTFHGNSGSAVLNSTTGQVEGILIMGKNDYQPSIPFNPQSCQVVNICDDSGKNCSAGLESGIVQHGEVVLRIETIAPLMAKALAAE